jgi:hypothetical protein
MVIVTSMRGSTDAANPTKVLGHGGNVSLLKVVWTWATSSHIAAFDEKVQIQEENE